MAHQPFHRPWTRLNVLVDATLGRMPVRHTISESDVARWRAEAVRVFGTFAMNKRALRRADTEPIWRITDRTDYDSAWSLEVTFDGEKTPLVNVFRNALWARLVIPRSLFEVAAQSAVDHAYGHLYPFYDRGKDRQWEGRITV